MATNFYELIAEAQQEQTVKAAREAAAIAERQARTAENIAIVSSLVARLLGDAVPIDKTIDYTPHQYQRGLFGRMHKVTGESVHYEGWVLEEQRKPGYTSGGYAEPDDIRDRSVVKGKLLTKQADIIGYMGTRPDGFTYEPQNLPPSLFAALAARKRIIVP
jgi:hypothetical protein